MAKYWFSILFLTIFLLACGKNDSFFNNDSIRENLRAKVEMQKEIAAGRYQQLFSVLDNNSLTSLEKEALSFLFAYMPLSDLANYNGDFFLNQVRYSLKAREYFPWGKKVPDDLFLHYVLPYRVNNEYLDTARAVFFEELKKRLKGLNMKEAALEINHWCHEKVTYQSTDYRTSSPLNTIKTAFGRCGEQSTFTVTAMRAAGIPARQIYTPRWAHTDDNHAWVEVWIDGQWFYMGACEPEPELNMGWFEGPATRAMLLHHKTYGEVLGPEEINSVNNCYTEINVLDRYAPVRRVMVKVLDSEGKPVKGANVEFKYPNYAELYPLTSTFTNDYGSCNLMTGKGDVLVWTYHQGKFAWKISNAADSDTLVLKLGNPVLNDRVYNYLFHAPPPSQTIDHSHVDRSNHIKRLHQEDSIRTAYEKTFIDSISAIEIARKYDLDPKKTFLLFKLSRGNWRVVKQFLNYAAPIDGEKALSLLSVISHKDLRDTPFKVLKDHFDNSHNPKGFDWDIYRQYILNPRIRNELISVYKSYFQKQFSPSFQEMARNDVRHLLTWIRDSIKIVNGLNPWDVPQLPRGVFEMRVADQNSINIFFVAVARSLGIPARIDFVRNQPQFFSERYWLDVNLQYGSIDNTQKGTLVLDFKQDNHSDELPAYFKNFTIAKLVKGKFKTLDYSYTNLFNDFPVKLELDTGIYLLTSVKRLADGSVKTRLHFFDIKKHDSSFIKLIFPDSGIETNKYEKVKLNLDVTVQNCDTRQNLLLNDLVEDNGLVLVWLDPSLEPSKHLLNDFIRLKSNFDNWNGNIALLIDSVRLSKSFNSKQYEGLPKKSIFLIDNLNLLKEYIKFNGKVGNYDLPYVLVLNSDHEVIFESKGYRIGIGDEIIGKVEKICRIP